MTGSLQTEQCDCRLTPSIWKQPKGFSYNDIPSNGKEEFYFPRLKIGI